MSILSPTNHINDLSDHIILDKIISIECILATVVRDGKLDMNGQSPMRSCVQTLFVPVSNFHVNLGRRCYCIVA